MVKQALILHLLLSIIITQQLISYNISVTNNVHMLHILVLHIYDAKVKLFSAPASSHTKACFKYRSKYFISNDTMSSVSKSNKLEKCAKITTH